MYKSLTKAKYTQWLEAHISLKRVASANAILNPINVFCKNCKMPCDGSKLFKKLT